MNRVGAVVMAAGAGRRMGRRPKALLLRDGVPLIERTVRWLLASGVAGELTAQAECDSLAQWFDRQTGKEDSACLWP